MEIPPPAEGMMAEKPKKRRGCLFWGCLTVVALFVVVGGCIGINLYMLREHFTSPAPKPIPKYEVKPGEYEKIETQLSQFDQASQKDQPAQLEFTADDLNALLAKHPDLKDLSGKAFVRMEDDRALLDVSIPLDNLPIPFVKGRYFNGSVALTAYLENGELKITPESATVNEEPLPENVLKNIGEMITQILKEEMGDDFRKGLRELKAVEIRGGKLVIER